MSLLELEERHRARTLPNELLSTFSFRGENVTLSNLHEKGPKIRNISVKKRTPTDGPAPDLKKSFFTSSFKAGYGHQNTKNMVHTVMRQEAFLEKETNTLACERDVFGPSQI